MPKEEMGLDAKSKNAGFLVIGAGLPRTGTLSLKTALEQLLDGPCYHGFTLAGGTVEDWDFWICAFEGKNKTEDFQNYLVNKKGVKSGCDFPIAYFYRELMEAFPDAKVLLSVRDPETWYHSALNAIYCQKAMAEDFAVRMYLRMHGAIKMIDFNAMQMMNPPKGMEGVDKGLLEAIGEGREVSINLFNAWNDEVKRVVPKERLLVHESKQGWKPICDFLNLSVPDTEYPRVNNTKQMKSKMDEMFRKAYLVVYGGPVIIGILIYFLVHCL